MFEFNDHNSWMILGLTSALTNEGALSEKERKAMFDLGYFIEECNTIQKAKKLVSEIEELLENK